MIYIFAVQLITIGHSFGKGKGYLATDFIIERDPYPESVMYLECTAMRDYLEFHNSHIDKIYFPFCNVPRKGQSTPDWSKESLT